MPVAFVEIGDRVFVARYRQWDVNVGLVLSDDAALLVDSRASLTQGTEVAADVAALLRRLGMRPVPVRHVVNTHVHFDHRFGNAAFVDAEVVAHRAVLDRGVAEAAAIKAAVASELSDPATDWSANPYGYGPQDARDLLATTVRPPDRTLEQTLTLHLGEREVQLQHWGRAHTDGDITVSVGDAGVVFFGDLIEEADNPSMGADSFPDEWAHTLRRALAGLTAQVAVPGHGRPVDRDFVVAQADWIGATVKAKPTA